MDRLLSEQEQCKLICGERYGECVEDSRLECNEVAIVKITAIAQDAKSCSARDKEWVEWIEKNCTGDVYGGMTFLHKAWQERKQEIGL